jgi:predicted aspartyl protease
MSGRILLICLVALSSAAISATIVHAEAPLPPVRVRMAPPAPRATGEAAKVAMDLASGMPVIEVMANGKGPFRFAVDTGAGGHAHISADLASKLALTKIGEARVADGSLRNARNVSLFAVDSLTIGGVTFHDLTTAATNPRSGAIDGVIGMALVQAFTLTFDYPAKALSFDKSELPPADGKRVFDYAPGHVIVIPVKVGTVEIPTHLDTGNARFPLIVASDIVPRLATRGTARSIGQARTISNTVDMFAIEVAGPVSIGDVKLPINEVGYPTVAPGGNLGSLGLMSVILRVDQKNRRVALETR